MMPRILLFLAAGILPLAAQASLKNGGHMYPADPSTVAPSELPAAGATLQPGVNAPPPGVAAPPPQRPATPLIHPRMVEFTVSPTTFRQGMGYKDELKTRITLNVPAARQMVFHITTSEPTKVTCTDIILVKNSTNNIGGIRVIWTAIHHDCAVEFKAFSDDDPDVVLHGRMYFKKKLE